MFVGIILVYTFVTTFDVIKFHYAVCSFPFRSQKKTERKRNVQFTTNAHEKNKIYIIVIIIMFTYIVMCCRKIKKILSKYL